MMNGQGHDNPTFVGDSVFTVPAEFRRNITQFYPGKHLNQLPPAQFQVRDEKIQPDTEQQKDPKLRDSWGNSIEFLLSCIAMSVGLGNYNCITFSSGIYGFFFNRKYLAIPICKLLSIVNVSRFPNIV